MRKQTRQKLMGNQLYLIIHMPMFMINFNRKNKIFKVFMEMTYGCNLKCRHCYLGTDINHVQTRFYARKGKDHIR